MRSFFLPPDRGYSQLWWRDWWFVAVLVLIALAGGVIGCIARADERDEAKAKAALALARAKREREQTKVASRLTCHTDQALAEKEAAKSHKHLVLWVGVTCAEHPELRKALDQAVHCHVEKWAGSSEPRVVIKGGDGMVYYVTPEKIDDRTATKVLRTWALPAGPPPVHGAKAGVAEELSRRTRAPCEICGPTCDCGPGCVCDRETAKRKAIAVRPLSSDQSPPVIVTPIYPNLPPVHTHAAPITGQICVGGS